MSSSEESLVILSAYSEISMPLPGTKVCFLVTPRTILARVKNYFSVFPGLSLVGEVTPLATLIRVK